MQIALTKDLQTFLGIKIFDDPAAQDFFLNSWLAHCFVFKRKKYFLFMNPQTLFCVMLVGVKKNSFISDFFAELLTELERAGISKEIINKLPLNFNNATFIKNKDRALTAALNNKTKEMTFAANYYSSDLLAIPTIFTAKYNNTRMCNSKNIAQKYFIPVELLFEKLNLPLEQIKYEI